MKLSLRAELHVPGETGRQARVFVIWFVCLAAALVAAAIKRPRVPDARRGTSAEQTAMEQSRRERLPFAIVLGLLVPGVLTWWETQRRRRGGPHPRGITVDVTPEGNLRVWGRGYGSRARLAGAVIEERLVNVFAGRLGAWCQRRIVVRATKAHDDAGHRGQIELSTRAIDDDLDLELRREGGEGDCIELSREDFMKVRGAVLELSAASSSQGATLEA